MVRVCVCVWRCHTPSIAFRHVLQRSKEGCRKPVLGLSLCVCVCVCVCYVCTLSLQIPRTTESVGSRTFSCRVSLFSRPSNLWTDLPGQLPLRQKLLSLDSFKCDTFKNISFPKTTLDLLCFPAFGAAVFIRRQVSPAVFAVRCLKWCKLKLCLGSLVRVPQCGVWVGVGVICVSVCCVRAARGTRSRSRLRA